MFWGFQGEASILSALGVLRTRLSLKTGRALSLLWTSPFLLRLGVFLAEYLGRVGRALRVGQTCSRGGSRGRQGEVGDCKIRGNRVGFGETDVCNARADVKRNCLPLPVA